MSLFHSPLRYPGGKNSIFNFVSSLIQENGLVGCKYVEPYAGGAGLALRLLYEEYVDSIVINDYDPIVRSFWQVCVSDADRLISWVEDTPITVESWKRAREILRGYSEFDGFDVAASFLFLNRTNVSGVLNGGVIGGINQEGKYKIDARFNKVEIIRRIEKISRFANRIEVSGVDGVKLLDKYVNYKDGVFLYLDPPYYVKGSNLYLNFYKDEDHAALAEKLAGLSTPWLLSYDDHEFIRRLYPGYKKCSYRLQHSTSNKVGSEIVVFSERISCDAAISKLSCVSVI